MTTSPTLSTAPGTMPPGTDRIPPAAATGEAATRRGELASFLRSRRERIKPEDVGFAPGRRRRTPGLRREEVAQLAGVGVTWYTWLEQGRKINVSRQVLDAVARTLRLDRLERTHLFTLAGIRVDRDAVECSGVSPATLRVLRQLSPYPACVMNQRYDVLAYNDAYGKAILDLDAIPVEDRNLLWLMFAYEDWHCAFPDSDEMAAHLVAGYRAAMAEHLDEPAWVDLTERLSAVSEEFTELWDRYDVAAPSSRIKLVESPSVGWLRLEPSNLWVGQGRTVRAVIYTPADDETERRLHQLTA